MSLHKRNKLKAKRTPWIKSRYSRKARAIQGVMRASILARGLANVNAIRGTQIQVSNAFTRAAKSMAMASAAMAAMSAVSKVPLYGSKTV